MDRISGRDDEAVETGSLLRVGETREIAIYQRGGLAWVADFRGGHGELFTAAGWLAVHGHGSLLHRAGLGSVSPLPADVIERIERLHAAEDRVGLFAPTARFLDRMAKFVASFSFGDWDVRPSRARNASNSTTKG